MVEDFSVIILPLGIMLLLNPIAEWGLRNGGNAYILGFFMMYISWVVVYFALIYPELNKKIKNGRNRKFS